MKLSKQTLSLFGYVLLALILYLLPVRSGVILNHHYMMGVRIDYVVHFLLFFPVPLLIRKNTNQRIELMNILILAASIAIEGFHLVIPGRSFNPYDALANVSGAVAGMIASWLLDSIRHRS